MRWILVNFVSGLEVFSTNYFDDAILVAKSSIDLELPVIYYGLYERLDDGQLSLKDVFLNERARSIYSVCYGLL